MSGSCHNGKEDTLRWLNQQTDIKTIVDVGAGSGTYRTLIGKRNYYWIAIEVFPKYIEMFDLPSLYDEILIGNIYDFALGNIEGGLPQGDLIIFGDVLEHLEKAQALKVLKIALKKYPHVVVSIPVDGRPSKIHYGNEREAHLSTWQYPKVKALADWKLTLESGGIGVFIK